MTDTLGARLALLRAKKDISQRELAEKTGVSWSQISRYESDLAVPRLRTLVKLAGALGVPLDELAIPESNGEEGREVTMMLTGEQTKILEDFAESQGISFNDAINKAIGMGLKMKMDRDPDLLAQLEADIPGGYEKLLKLLGKES